MADKIISVYRLEILSPVIQIYFKTDGRTCNLNINNYQQFKSLDNIENRSCMTGKYDEEKLEMRQDIHALAKKIAQSVKINIDIFPGDLSIALQKNHNELNNFIGECFVSNTGCQENPQIIWFVKHIYQKAAVDNLPSFEDFKTVLAGGLINKAYYFKKKQFPSSIIKFYRDALNFYADPKQYEAKKALLFLLVKSRN